MFFLENVLLPNIPTILYYEQKPIDKVITLSTEQKKNPNKIRKKLFQIYRKRKFLFFKKPSSQDRASPSNNTKKKFNKSQNYKQVKVSCTMIQQSGVHTIVRNGGIFKNTQSTKYFQLIHIKRDICLFRLGSGSFHLKYRFVQCVFQSKNKCRFVQSVISSKNHCLNLLSATQTVSGRFISSTTFLIRFQDVLGVQQLPKRFFPLGFQTFRKF
eukprot:TRINITY_DN18123_c0_g1_i2.p2 TRINITY_DN18123_c0_g1~~TRINITY_DN18123_c0_g1_i2.p2  ORF type:complete len:213 (-),score=-9.95 TRINITY_DN18123_c0_g1_i2:136-774(-)